MKFERLKALKRGKGYVHYNGELYGIVDINDEKQTAQISRVGSMFETAKEVSAEELD